MSQGSDVLERSCLQAGKVFIKAGEENARAYIVQNGEVASFVMDGDEKIEIGRFGPGTLIGELSLVVDDPLNVSYEAITTTTVITVTRQEFQKRLTRTSNVIKTVIDHAVEKLAKYENQDTLKAREKIQFEDEAFDLAKKFLTGIPEDKKFVVEKAILPHINGLVQEMKKLKESA